jgi:O-methyltransferase
MSLSQTVIDAYVKIVKPLLPRGARRWLRRIRHRWAYRTMRSLPGLTPEERRRLIERFIQVDLDIEHGHRPGEMIAIAREVLARPAREGEVRVEAGCWAGGSTAKFSMLCKLKGYRLLVYDSFEGVEKTDQAGHDFSGEYAADIDSVKRNIERFGEIDVCEFYKGWFADTLAANPVREPVAFVYIDCDLAKGTFETLQGTLPSLTTDGVVFSQDYHIPVVKKLLHDPDTWQKLGRTQPKIEYLVHHLSRFTW